MRQESYALPQAFLWDVGGTLVDRVCSPLEAMSRAFSQEGLLQQPLSGEALRHSREAYEASERNWRTLAEEERGFTDFASLVLQGCGVAASAEQIGRLGRILGDYDAQYRPVPGIPELLDELHRRGIRQGIVSNWPPSLPRFLRHHGLGRYFTPMVGSCAEGRFKPDAALFQCALDSLGIQPHEAVYIGNDPELDMAPARALGMRAVHFDPRREHPDAHAHTTEELRPILLQLLDFRNV
jgi:HAD superfamily hydrolase (TIGR01549 family)